MEKLNHFILWCKGWYEPIDETVGLQEQVCEILKLDGYTLCRPKDVIGIVSRYVDELIDTGVISSRDYYFRMEIWNQTVWNNMNLYDLDFKSTVLLNFKRYFAYHFKGTLDPPTYSRRLYKMGFVAPSHFGNSYKMQNYKAKKFFNK